MMKKILKIYIPIVIFLFIISAGSALADCNSVTHKDSVTGEVCGLDYVPLTNAFTGLSSTPSTGTNSLGNFLGQVFSFGIALAVALALIMIIWGGIEYMTTDSWENKDNGKKRIGDALWGLGLALASYLILYTINPCLVIYLGSSNSACKTSNSFLYPTGITAPANTNNNGNSGATPGLFNGTGGTIKTNANPPAQQKVPTATPPVQSDIPVQETPDNSASMGV
jgi:hypothetical protein